MAFSVATSINDTFEVPGAGVQAFLFGYPSGGYTGGTLALKLANIMTNIYTDGTKLTPLTASQWAAFDSNGLQVAAKGVAIEVEKLTGPKHPIGFACFEADITGTFIDVDQAHMRDITSATTGEELTVAAGTGQYGYKSTLVGSQKNIRQFGMILRVPSVVVTTGTVVAYDHYVFPKVVCVPELDIKFSKKDPLSAKVKFTALTDSTIVSPDSAQPVLYIHMVANGAAT